MTLRTALISSLAVGCAPAGTLLDGDPSTEAGVLSSDTGRAGSDTADSAEPDSSGQDSEGIEHNGEYQGWYEMVLGLGDYSDTCEGQIWISVDVDTEPQITGSSECEFHGLAAEYFKLRDTYTSGMSGTVTEAPQAEGSVVAELGPMGEVAVPWTGSFDDDTLVGELSGSTTLTIEGYELDIAFSGAFSAMR